MDTYLPNGLNMKAKYLFIPHSISKIVPRKLWKFYISHNPLSSHLYFWLIQIIGKCFYSHMKNEYCQKFAKKLDFRAKKIWKNSRPGIKPGTFQLWALSQDHYTKRTCLKLRQLTMLYQVNMHFWHFARVATLTEMAFWMPGKVLKVEMIIMKIISKWDFSIPIPVLVIVWQ